MHIPPIVTSHECLYRFSYFELGTIQLFSCDEDGVFVNNYWDIFKGTIIAYFQALEQILLTPCLYKCQVSLRSLRF